MPPVGERQFHQAGGRPTGCGTSTEGGLGSFPRGKQGWDPRGRGGAAKMHAGVGATTDPWGHGPSAPRGHLAVKGPEKHEIERELQSVWEGRGLH